MRRVVHTALKLRPDLRVFTLGTRMPVEGATPLIYYPAAEIMSAFDTGVGEGSYNMVHELLASAIPSAFFAKERIVDDQSARIERYTALGACIALGDPFGPVLEASLNELLNSQARRDNLSRNARSFVPRGGLKKAAISILRRWGQQQNRTHGPR